MSAVINYNLCHPSHWGYVEEMPKIEEYMIGICESGTCRDCGETKDCGYRNFDNTLSIWRSKYGEEPEPEWIKFEDREPEVIQEIYLKNKNNEESKSPVKFLGKTELWEQFFDFWCDTKELDERRAIWNYHQKKYPNWMCENHSHMILHATNGKHKIFFNLLDKEMEIYEINDVKDKLIYQGAILTTTGLKEVAGVNGIEL